METALADRELAGGLRRRQVHNWETKDPYLTAWVRLRQASDAALRATEIELGKRQTTLAQMDVLLILSMSKVP